MQSQGKYIALACLVLKTTYSILVNYKGKQQWKDYSGWDNFLVGQKKCSYSQVAFKSTAKVRKEKMGGGGKGLIHDIDITSATTATQDHSQQQLYYSNLCHQLGLIRSWPRVMVLASKVIYSICAPPPSYTACPAAAMKSLDH